MTTDEIWSRWIERWALGRDTKETKMRNDRSWVCGCRVVDRRREDQVEFGERRGVSWILFPCGERAPQCARDAERPWPPPPKILELANRRCVKCDWVGRQSQTDTLREVDRYDPEEDERDIDVCPKCRADVEWFNPLDNVKPLHGLEFHTDAEWARIARDEAVAAVAEPDPDEVRRACDYYEDPGFRMDPMVIGMKPALAAARAWLKLRERVEGLEQLAEKASRLNELIMNNRLAFPDARVGMSAIDIAYDFMLAHAMDQQQLAEPAPTIAQVIEACGNMFCDLHIYGCSDKTWKAEVTHGVDSRAYAFADTPEAAIAKLYDDAVARLEADVAAFQIKRDEAAAKLQKLGRS